jgi:hypothetical protein
VQPEQPDLDYIDLSDKTVLEIDNPRGKPTNATVTRRCLLKRKAQTDVPAPNPAPKSQNKQQTLTYQNNVNHDQKRIEQLY